MGNDPVYILIVGEAPGPTEIEEMELNMLASVFSPRSKSGRLIRGIIESTIAELPGSVVPGYINGYNKLPRDAEGRIRKPTREEFNSCLNIETINKWLAEGKPILFVGKSVWEHVGSPRGNNIRVVNHPSYTLRFGHGGLSIYKTSVSRCLKDLCRPGGPAPELRIVPTVSA